MKAVLTAEGIHADRTIAHRIDLRVDVLPGRQRLQGALSQDRTLTVPLPDGRAWTIEETDRLLGDSLQDMAGRSGFDLL
ncbi:MULTISPECIES: hypothetical protein [Methylobacterium]|uniref:hypothetical protein n=1 Tax=Methylobacterium TaxID=407 RepID=UPI0013EBDB6C|nr:hypothetical protein [Methylobacterium sp. DB0501]NGM36211.1 hypothetical protein [Methylobacterium sp. DB0501]